VAPTFTWANSSSATQYRLRYYDPVSECLLSVAYYGDILQ